MHYSEKKYVNVLGKKYVKILEISPSGIFHLVLATLLVHGEVTLTNLTISSYGQAIAIEFEQQVHVLEESVGHSSLSADNVIIMRSRNSDNFCISSYR